MSNQGTNIPINKGNYSLDTPEREALFEENRGFGWEEKYGDYRRNWVDYPKHQYVSEYPLLLDLELSSICNLKCPMCYTLTEEFKRKVNTGLMDFSLFKGLLDEVGGKVPALRLSLRGEPTLHPNFTECIEYAKESGIGEVSFLTNGSRFTLDYFKKIADAGADWITISIDGLGETYDKIRRPLKFQDTLRKLKDIKAYKDKHKLKKPVIKAQAVWPSIRHNPEEYYDVLANFTDLIAFNPLIDYLGKDSEIVYMEDFTCPQHYQRLVIGSDGLAMMCSNDEECTTVVGDANSSNVYEIWHGEKLQSLRETHKKEKGFMEIPVCRKCYLPRATEETEKARVHDREFIVVNYVNRKQEIGY